MNSYLHWQGYRGRCLCNDAYCFMDAYIYLHTRTHACIDTYLRTYIHINIIHDIISAVEYNWGLNRFHHYRGDISALDTTLFIRCLVTC